MGTEAATLAIFSLSHWAKAATTQQTMQQGEFLQAKGQL